MSDRPYIKPQPVITNVSMAASITSAVTILAQKTGAGYDIAWTGAPVGSFSVQISNTVVLNGDGSISSASPGTWTSVTLSGAVNPSGSADNGFINLAGLEAYAVRLVYTRSSGTGVLNATICSKVQ